MEIRLAPLSQEQRSVAYEKIAKKKAAHSKSAPSSRRTSPSPSTSGSSKAGPDTPPPIPTPGPSPLDMSTFDARFSGASAEDSDRTVSTAGWKHRSAGKRRAQSAALSLSIPSTRQRSGSSALKSSSSSNGPASSLSSSSGSGSASTLTGSKSHGITSTTSNLKRMPTHDIRAWEEELEMISTRSKRRSDEMLSGGSGSTSDVEKSMRSIRGTRTRRGTVTAMPPPPSAYAFARRHPPAVAISDTS